MIKYIIMIIIAAIFGFIVGFMLGVDKITRGAADGICIRADDGEAYLRISEMGQKKIMDPSTRLLYIRVVDMSTRNKQSL